MKKINIPLSKLSFLNALISTIILTGSFLGISTYESLLYYNDRVENIEISYINKNKDLLRNEINVLATQILIRVEDEYNSFNNIADDRIQTAIKIYKSMLKYNEKEKIQAFYKIMDNFVYEKQYKGAMFIFAKNGQILFHNVNKKVLNKNVFEIFAKNPEILNLVKKAISEGEATANISIPQDHIAIESIGTQRNIKIKTLDDGLFIGTSIFIDEVDAQIKNSIFKEIETLRFGLNDYGYFWFIDKNGDVVYHPVDKHLIGKSLRKIKSKNNVSIMDKIDKTLLHDKQGYIKYDWQIPGTNINSQKISFVKKLDIWDLTIGAGFYLYDLQEAIASEKKKLTDLLVNVLLKTILIVLLISTIIIFLAFLISRKFYKVEKSQIKYLGILEQYKNILDKSTIVSRTDTHGKITAVNSLFEKACGFSKEELVGQTHKLIKNPSTPRETFEDLWRTIKKGETWHGLIKNRKKDGHNNYYAQTTITPFLDEDGITKEYIAVCIDVTEMVEQKDKINKIFLTDNLTSLGSRVKLLEVISKAKNSNLALLDMDRFTEINDTYGNKVGDIILRGVAKEIFRFHRSYNISVYRLHADVFAVYSETYTIREFEEIIKELVEHVSSKIFHKEADVLFTFTVGLAHGDENIIALADMALKSAKQSNQSLVVYDEKNPMLAGFEDNLIWMKKLSIAIEQKRIVPFYQPIYNYKTKKIEKYEVLMRYIEEDGSEVSPFKFLDIAKKTKVYPSLTKSVVGGSVDYFKDHREYEFSINVTIEDLLNEETMQYIYSIVAKNKLFENLVIEIVESEELVGFDYIKKVLQKFQKEGTKIAIDDFGSGYSNYAYLLKLEVDFIKIDGSIIKKLYESQSSRDLVKSIVDWSQKSNIKTIGEFVSNEETDKIVKELNIDFAQGYLYGKPLNRIDV